MTKTKFEVMDICNPLDIPVGPILSLKELAEDQGLRDTNTIVEVDHPERGKYLTVGNPIKLSDSPAKVERSPLLGEHTDEILKEFCQAESATDARYVHDLLQMLLGAAAGLSWGPAYAPRSAA